MAVNGFALKKVAKMSKVSIQEGFMLIKRGLFSRSIVVVRLLIVVLP